MFPLRRFWKCRSWPAGDPASDAASTPVTIVDICRAADSGEAITGTARLARSDGSPVCSAAFAVVAPSASVIARAIVTNAVMISMLTSGIADATVATFPAILAAIVFGPHIFDSIIVVVLKPCPGIVLSQPEICPSSATLVRRLLKYSSRAYAESKPGAGKAPREG